MNSGIEPASPTPDVWNIAATVLTGHPTDASDVSFAMAVYQLRDGNLEQFMLWSLTHFAIRELTRDLNSAKSGTGLVH